MRPTFVAIVLTAIQLNRQTQFRAVKIENIGFQGMLTAELPTIHPTISKTGPQQSLGIRGVTPQLAGELNEFETLARDFVTDFLQASEHDFFTA